MKILVTGGSGFIGSHLVRLLVEEKGEAVVNLDKLTYAGSVESLADLDGNSRYAFEQVDLCDQNSLKEVFEKHRPDAVLHLAAETHVDRSIDGPGEFIQSNIVGTYNLLQASLDYWRSLPTSLGKFRFLHVSTDEVYGALSEGGSSFTESTAYDPHSPYAASKAASDHLVRAWGCTYGLPILVTNCSNNYGPFQYPEKLIPVVISKCLEFEPIPVYGNGSNIRDWLHVKDHVEALYTVLIRGRVGETYNIGGGSEVTNIALVRALCGLMDELSPAKHRGGDLSSYGELITFVADRPGHDLRYSINATKIRDELGWQAQVSFAEGLRQTVEWYFENQ